MGSIDEIMQVCRLCLVKDKVNIPIFDESNNSEEIFNKICSCLPVKVSREDNLPKKICDGCSYKLELLYTFRNTSVDSEKQLMSLLNQAGLSACSLNSTLVRDATKPEVLVKQETLEPADSRMENENSDVCPDAQSYIMQQQQLPYQQDFAFAEASGSSEVPTEEPPPKRARRSNPVKKPPVQTDSEDEDLDLAMQITKAEDEDSDDVDQPDYVEPSTSADDQPGPSGVGKDVVEAPSLYQDHLYTTSYSDITSIQTNNLHLQCKYLMSMVNAKEPEIPDNILESDSDLLNLLSTEDDCSDILDNIAANEQFEHLINSESNFVDEFISEMKEEPRKAENMFKCYQCSKEFKSKQLLRKHLFIHTGIKRFSCDVCSKAFKYRCEVEEHKKSHNSPTFQCEICSKMFVYKSHLDVHRRKHLNEFVASCKQCNIGFVSKFSYKTHMNLVHKNLQLICDVCGSKLSSMSSLKEHKLTHDPNYKKERPHVCEVCGKSYLTLRNLRGHMKVHQQIRSHVCNICGKSVSGKKILETHIKMHTGLKDFVCNICDKAFASKEYLTLHYRTHTGNKPFSCDVCGKRFTQKTSLTVHMRYHTGERPYKCECGKEFTTKSHLMTHYKAHDVGGVDIDYISRPLI